MSSTKQHDQLPAGGARRESRRMPNPLFALLLFGGAALVNAIIAGLVIYLLQAFGIWDVPVVPAAESLAEAIPGGRFDLRA
jgi:hypothetical protein